jgi:acetyltransferase-like isoleucine patch superfamily enzyme
MRGLYLRQAFYQSVLDECGRDVVIGWGTLFSMTQAKLGDRAYIGRNCNIGYGMIGSEAMLADGVIVLSGGREHGSEIGQSMHQQSQAYCPVSIGRGAWIGAGAIIMSDVGDHAIIGAGAVVNKPIPAGSIAVGVPARVVKWRVGWTETGQQLPIVEPKDY